MKKLKYVGQVTIYRGGECLIVGKYVQTRYLGPEVYYKTADGWINPYQSRLENIIETYSINELFKQTYGSLLNQSVITGIGDF